MDDDSWCYPEEVENREVEPDQSPDTLFDARPYFDDAAFSDVTVDVPGQRVKAHRMILCAESPFFKNALGPNSPWKACLASMQLLHDL